MLHVPRAIDVLKSLLLVSIIVHKFRSTTGLLYVRSAYIIVVCTIVLASKM